MEKEIVCKNGHTFNIKDKHAKKGWCLACKSFVHVPRRDLSDESALAFLGEHIVSSKPKYSTSIPNPLRNCGKCHQQIDTKICPHCRTYVGL